MQEKKELCPYNFYIQSKMFKFLELVSETVEESSSFDPSPVDLRLRFGGDELREEKSEDDFFIVTDLNKYH